MSGRPSRQLISCSASACHLQLEIDNPSAQGQGRRGPAQAGYFGTAVAVEIGGQCDELTKRPRSRRPGREGIGASPALVAHAQDAVWRVFCLLSVCLFTNSRVSLNPCSKLGPAQGSQWHLLNRRIKDGAQDKDNKRGISHRSAHSMTGIHNKGGSGGNGFREQSKPRQTSRVGPEHESIWRRQVRLVPRGVPVPELRHRRKQGCVSSEILGVNMAARGEGSRLRFASELIIA